MSFSIAVPVEPMLIADEVVERGVVVGIQLAARFQIVAEDLLNDLGIDPVLLGDLKGTQGGVPVVR